MITKIPSKLKLSIAVFVLSFLFFLVYTITDDIILKSPLGQQKVISLSIRLALSISFSTLIASLVFYFVRLIYSSMRSLVTLAQDWGNEVYEETPAEERDDEIGELVRAFRLKFFQQKESKENPSSETLGEINKEIADSIQRAFYRIQLPKILNLDVSLFPRMSGNSNCDYTSVVPSADGCVGILAGFSSPGILESAFKARIEGIFSLANETSEIPGEELVFKIGKILSKMPIPFLNLSLFYLKTKTGELGYIHFQELPAFVYKNNEFIVLEKNKARYFDYKAVDLEIHKTVLKTGEYWVLISDRTHSAIGISASEFIKQFQNVLAGKNFQNSRDLILDCGRTLEQKYGKKVLETSALLAITRKN
ncbi:Arg-Lys translocation region protein phosphatase [Leptospira interrogans]|uniref:Arg-Lys translocation region protein phosphatase n=16 Tax=Leptospira interrogans TaxID=173 RepID=A0A1X8WPK2_LEPIR|nr:Arg-Lys translocation region protein phosphatase RktP [Leptospira interrogans]EMF43687.1 hypothetical protein LEP1GSC067_3247 [Leptospira interrogans serovar Lora str. TE 1992]EMF70189.1 hypothetical protein LEP1GSC148_0538 [Leptospira interrogans serovar Canicola str. LT1962]EMM94982.1 hypothetical protein LEP1GSC158_2028 [Leptospira interrogans serovar Zanoni str. LT2156]EMY25071.1 Arg-Lys translocation region protein phosphatase [Leptospira interrogans serovar Australis str. 200703203]OC